MKKTTRSHPYKITPTEAKKVWTILKRSRPMIKRLEDLLNITTGAKGTHPIGQGFRNDINQILKAARGRK
jgi:hypothetical protein